jgi:phospholipid-binding lipoprotein MlaA
LNIPSFAALMLLAAGPVQPAAGLPTPGAEPAPVEQVTVEQAPAEQVTAAPLPEPEPLAAPPVPLPPADGAPEDEGITVTARLAVPADPLESVNVVSFEAVAAVDDAVVAPVAHGYMKTVPGPVQLGVRNFLNNLDEPVVFVNFLLQHKIGKALETVGRFAINSTVGVAGLIDVAKRKPFRLPRRPNGLGSTLGFYGIPNGPYFFLPLIGPTTLRDMLGRMVDLSVLPTAVGKPFTEPLVTLGKGTLSAIDDRVEADAELRDLRENTADSYLATRERYLARRKAEIDVLRGKRRSVDDPRPPEKR